MAGSGGQLPNLDLVNLAVLTAQQEGLIEHFSLDYCRDAGEHGRTCNGTPLAVVDAVRSVASSILSRTATTAVVQYVHRLHTMFGFMFTLASGPTGVHSDFLSFEVEAITLRTVSSSSLSSSSSSSSSLSSKKQKHLNAVQPKQLVRVVEKLIRCMSSLEEELHQSFFAYILPGPGIFISIGEYTYPFVLIVSPLLLSTLRISTAMRDYASLSPALAAVAGAGLIGILFMNLVAG
jgi:glycosylphosphatidylinositol transamidase